MVTIYFPPDRCPCCGQQRKTMSVEDFNILIRMTSKPGGDGDVDHFLREAREALKSGQPLQTKISGYETEVTVGRIEVSHEAGSNPRTVVTVEGWVSD